MRRGDFFRGEEAGGAAEDDDDVVGGDNSIYSSAGMRALNERRGSAPRLRAERAISPGIMGAKYKTRKGTFRPPPPLAPSSFVRSLVVFARAAGRARKRSWRNLFEFEIREREMRGGTNFGNGNYGVRAAAVRRARSEGERFFVIIAVDRCLEW